MFDADGNTVPSGSTEGSGSSWSSSASSSSTEHDAFRPVLGKELSSVESLSLEDQRFLAVAAIQTQGDRHAVARVAGRKEPTAFRTDDVNPSEAGKHWAEEYREQLLINLSIALPFTEALAELENRQDSLRRELVSAAQDEEAPAKRRIKRP